MSWEKHSEAVRTLPVPLTDAQMAEVGHELGDLHAKIVAAEEDRATLMKALKAAIDAQKAEAGKLAHTLAERTRDDTVPVRVEVNFPENALRIVRMDSGEVVETRALTPEEREKLSQRPLPGTVPENVVPMDPNRRVVRRRKGQPDVDVDGLPPEPDPAAHTLAPDGPDEDEGLIADLEAADGEA